MRMAIVIVAVVIAVLFAGGAINIGSGPLFWHIDNLFGTETLMNVHCTVFSFMYRGHATEESSASGVKDSMDEFQKKPIGIDNKKNYRRLNEASQY